MFYVRKRIMLSCSHNLNLPYETPCNNLHGHNYVIYIHCKSKELNENDMVVDFKEIKSKIHNKLDHQNLNEVLGFHPTAENLSKWICEQITNCYKVEVYETENNLAVYEID